MGTIKDSSVIEIWNAEKYQTLRQDMLDGVWNDACANCKAQEHTPESWSFRRWANKEFEKHIPNVTSVTPPLTLRYVDIRWNNTCNLKCRTCSEDYSSLWAAEKSKINSTPMKQFKLVDSKSEMLMSLIKEHAIEIETVYFAGGDPLLIDEQYQLIDMLIEAGVAKDITLSYTTNGTVWNSKVDALVEKWKQFNKILVQISIDHVDPAKVKYIRHPADWNEVESNITKLVDRIGDKASIHTNTVVSIMNVYELPNIVDTILTKWDGKIRPHSITVLQSPQQFSIRNLPQQEKEWIANKILNYPKKFDQPIDQSLKNVVKFMLGAAPMSFEQFKREAIEKFGKHDKFRNEDFQKTFPELAKFLS